MYGGYWVLNLEKNNNQLSQVEEWFIRKTNVKKRTISKFIAPNKPNIPPILFPNKGVGIDLILKIDILLGLTIVFWMIYDGKKIRKCTFSASVYKM